MRLKRFISGTFSILFSLSNMNWNTSQKLSVQKYKWAIDNFEEGKLVPASSMSVLSVRNSCVRQLGGYFKETRINLRHSHDDIELFFIFESNSSDSVKGKASVFLYP